MSICANSNFLISGLGFLLFFILPTKGKSQWLYYHEGFSPFLSRIEITSLTNVVVRDPNTNIEELDIAFNKQGALFATGYDDENGPILLVDSLLYPGVVEIHRFATPMTGLCVDKNNKFWATDWNSTGGLYSFDPISNTETFHGNIGHFLTDLEFYDGNLYAIGWENKLTYYNNLLILVDQNTPSNSKIVMELALPFAFFSLASFNDSCGSNKLVAPGNQVLVFLDPENKKHQIIDIAPSFTSAGAASKTGWMGSVPPLDIDSITIVPDPCTGSTIITAHPQPGRSNFEFVMDDGLNQTDSTFTGVLPGTHILRIVDNMGCSKTYGPFEVFNINSGSVYNLSIQPDYCNLNRGQININFFIDNFDLEYSLNEITWQKSSEFNNLPGGEYTVFIKYPSGCHDTITISIPTLPAFEVKTNSSDEHCNMQDGKIEIIVNGGQGPNQFSIIGYPMFTNHPIIDSLSKGEYEVIVIDSLGCSWIGNVIVNEITPEIVSISIGQPTCSSLNGSIILEVSSGKQPILYSLNSGELQPIPIFQQLSTGSYNIDIIDAYGCELDTMVTLIASGEPPLLQIEVVNASCDQANGSIILHSDQSSLIYSLNQGVPQIEPIFDSLSAGVYTLISLNSEGCSIENIVDIFQLGKPVLEKIVVMPENCLQLDGSITIEDVEGGLTPYLYKIQDQSFQSSPHIYGLSAGDYIVIVGDGSGCYDTAYTNVSTNEGPIITDMRILPANCDSYDGSIEINAESMSSLIFTLNGVITNTGIFNNLQSGTYNLVIADTFGCSTSKEIYIPDSFAFFIDEIIITHPSCKKNVGSVDFISGFNDIFITNNDIPNQEWVNKIDGLLPGKYNLRLKNTTNCVIDTILTLEQPIGCGINMPNIFSPNSDKVNDEFGTYPYAIFSKWELSIFDRIGNMVFQSTNPNIGWKGSYRGNEAQPGVYIWHLNYIISENSDLITKTGDVTLLK